jgi:hypothetical protein
MNGVVFRTADPVFPLTEVAVAGGCSGSCEYLAALATRVILINWGSAHVLHRESLAWTGALRERVHARRQRHGVAQHRGRPLCVFSYYPTPAGAAGWEGGGGGRNGRGHTLGSSEDGRWYNLDYGVFERSWIKLLWVAASQLAGWAAPWG